ALYWVNFFDDRSVAAGRSSRFYKEDVQYDDRTNKKLECFPLHLRSPPFTHRLWGGRRADRRCNSVLWNGKHSTSSL
ncbi:MAG: hypothetical protein U0N25_05565, partial [Agathobaculum butyriciproducens]